jgi:hypothetical protein
VDSFDQFRSIIRRNAVFLTTIFAGAFAFELCVTSESPLPYQTTSLTKQLRCSSFDTASNKIWDTWNAGVCAPDPIYPITPTLSLAVPTVNVPRPEADFFANGSFNYSVNGRTSSPATWFRRTRMTSKGAPTLLIATV